MKIERSILFWAYSLWLEEIGAGKGGGEVFSLFEFLV